jgi:hypothetical protein
VEEEQHIITGDGQIKETIAIVIAPRRAQATNAGHGKRSDFVKSPVAGVLVERTRRKLVGRQIQRATGTHEEQILVAVVIRASASCW